jgi:hypothetical protein
MDGSNELGGTATPASAKDTSQPDDHSCQDDVEKQSIQPDNIPPNTVSHEKSAADPNIVNWDGPDDPENPMNWSLAKKMASIGIVSVLAFLSYVCMVHPIKLRLTLIN